MIDKFNTIGRAELEAVTAVIQRGPLSGYVATERRGGYEVRDLELAWGDTFDTQAVACNSATSGLLAACMAIGVGPMDEVIVPCVSMSATAAAPMVLGADIVFADVDAQFNIDPAEVSRLISSQTKAVIATNLFGHPAQLAKLKMICRAHDVVLIEDNSQSIMAKEDGQYTGTIGDIGVFSLNVHKHIQCGEGGICTTNNMDLKSRLNAAINHGEMRGFDFPGLNLRMSEVTAAIAYQQLKKLPEIVSSRQELGLTINSALDPYRHMIEPLPTLSGCEHSYYCWAGEMRSGYNSSYFKVNVGGEPIKISKGYEKGFLPHLAAFQRFTPNEDAFEATKYRLHDMILIELCSEDIKPEHIRDMAARIEKVYYDR